MRLRLFYTFPRFLGIGLGTCRIGLGLGQEGVLLEKQACLVWEIEIERKK